MIPVAMPKYTSFKTLADGSTGYYWTCPARYRKAGCPFRAAALGTNLPQAELYAAAKVWNDRLDAWRAERNSAAAPDTTRFGTLEWLVNTYLRHDSFLEHVSEFSRPDYRRVFDRVCATEIDRPNGMKGRIGDAKVNNIAVTTAEKIYKSFQTDGANRTSEKVVTYCKAMWKRMKPHYPELFRTDTPNPWEGVTLKKRTKKVKGHVDRETTYKFAEGAIRLERPELAAAAVLAFEFFLRPSNIGAGYAAWTGYRGESAPDKIVFTHRKTGERAEHPLEYVDEDGALIALYAQAEAILKQVPKYGLSIVCQKSGKLFGDGTRLSQDVRDIADKLTEEGALEPGFTLDAARHGGLTELEEQGLTEGQGRVLSKHKTATAYRGYAKETEKRVLEATKRRFGHSEQPELFSKNNGQKIEKNG